MTTTLAFDVYGTIIDTHGVVSKLQETVGDNADDFPKPGGRNSWNIPFGEG